MKASVVICAAGQGKRMKLDKNKQFLMLDGAPLLIHTLRVWEQLSYIDELVIVTGEQDLSFVEELLVEYKITKKYQLVVGGQERQDSVYQGLLALQKAPPDYVLIHDGARPFITKQQIDKVLSEVEQKRAVIVAIPVKDTIKRANNNLVIEETLKRDVLWSVQTPQAFSFELILQAHQHARAEDYLGTDDASLVELLGEQVSIVLGSHFNIKLTTPEDIYMAKYILREIMK